MIFARLFGHFRSVAGVGAALLVASACDTSTDLPLCLDPIPEGGCPIGRGGTCDDASCNALFDCIDRAWTLQQRCSGGTGGGSAGTGGGSATAGAGGSCTKVMLDHVGETTGCKPDLENPDCPIQAAETCAETACLTSCVDFFLCTKDGWTSVAYCDDQGQLFLSK